MSFKLNLEVGKCLVARSACLRCDTGPHLVYVVFFFYFVAVSAEIIAGVSVKIGFAAAKLAVKPLYFTKLRRILVGFIGEIGYYFIYGKIAVFCNNALYFKAAGGALAYVGNIGNVAFFFFCNGRIESFGNSKYH